MTAETILQNQADLVVLPDDGHPLDIAPECLKNIQKNWFTFSVAAYQIHNEELYKARGYANFKEYVEAELDIKYRVAMFRVEMGEAINMLSLTMEEVGDMGWTKFKYIAPRLNKDMKRKDLLALLNKARKSTVVEIKDFVAKELSTTRVVSQSTAMSFRFTNEQADIIKESMKEAMSLANSESQSVAIEYICSEWLMSKNPALAEKIRAGLSPEPVKAEVPRKKHAKPKSAAKKAPSKKAATKKAPAKKKATAKK